MNFKTTTKLLHNKMLWFNVIFGLNYISSRYKLITIHYHTLKQGEIKFKPRIEVNHNMYLN